MKANKVRVALKNSRSLRIPGNSSAEALLGKPAACNLKACKLKVSAPVEALGVLPGCTCLSQHEVITRRDLLRDFQSLILGAAAVTSLPVMAEASGVETLKLKHISATAAKLLFQTCHLLFPIVELDASVYWQIVRDIDDDVAAKSGVKKLVAAAPAVLDKQVSGDWLQASTKDQLEALAAIQGSALFGYLRNRTIESLYRNPEVWSLLGYQGSSIEKGGYLHRGFDDIDWLEEK